MSQQDWLTVQQASAMEHGSRWRGQALLSFVAIVCQVAAAGMARGQANTPGTEGDVQVLTRGPVHEAFAAPVVHDPVPGPLVAKAPPAPVEEMPPAEKPAGPNVQWIPGYWSWDQGRDDYVWVSGVWREPPPGRQWVPGYWHQAGGGFQWVPGAWVPVASNAGGQGSAAASAQAAYLPSPPTSLENGPSSPSPGSNVFWSPGSWYWQDNRYVWRPGFWAAVQTAWVWVPAHYVWTPGGYLFVEGFWDLPLASRGILFAPVYYPQPIYLQPAYVFTPSITIATPGLVANLFVQPSYGHYCFGDYYDRSFLSVGIFPWFSFTYASGPVMARPLFYDPVFSFYASVNMTHDPGWSTRVQQEYVVRRDNVAMRPPRTYIEQTRIIERNVNVNINRNLMARPIHELAGREAGGGLRMERVSSESRRQWQARGAELQQFRAERSRLEVQPSAHPRALALPASPVSAPIHHHLAAGQPIGPTGHGQHPAGSPAAAASPARAASPWIHHQAEGATAAPGPDHAYRVGQAAPHDVAREPLNRPLPGLHGGETGPRPGPPPLHQPPQYTHRQPPPPPRPLLRQAAPERHTHP